VVIRSLTLAAIRPPEAGCDQVVDGWLTTVNNLITT